MRGVCRRQVRGHLALRQTSRQGSVDETEVLLISIVELESTDRAPRCPRRDTAPPGSYTRPKRLSSNTSLPPTFSSRISGIALPQRSAKRIVAHSTHGCSRGHRQIGTRHHNQILHVPQYLCGRTPPMLEPCSSSCSIYASFCPPGGSPAPPRVAAAIASQETR